MKNRKIVFYTYIARMDKIWININDEMISFFFPVENASDIGRGEIELHRISLIHLFFCFGNEYVGGLELIHLSTVVNDK